MKDYGSREFWTPITNAFPPESVANLQPQGGISITTYLPRPDIKKELRKLHRSLFPDRGVRKAIVFGQRGSGKSSVLGYLADDLKKTHQVLWLDAISERAEVLDDPLALYVTIGLSAMQAMQQNKVEADKKLLEAFLSSLETTISEREEKKQDTFQLDAFIDGVADIVASGTKIASVFDPSILVATVVVDWARKLFKSFKAEDQKSETSRKTLAIPPQFDKAAGRLTTFIQDCEYRMKRPFIVILDGLDKVEASQVHSFYQKARDIARPQVRMLLTAPETLYTSMTFSNTGEFLSLFPVPNIRLGQTDNAGEKFLYELVEKRLATDPLHLSLDDVFGEGVLLKLIAASGGNIRTLINLVYEACIESEDAGSIVDFAACESAIDRVQGHLAALVSREDEMKALVDFNAQPGLHKLLPSGVLGDEFLRAKLILMYSDKSGVDYSLNPLIRKEMQEKGL